MTFCESFYSDPVLKVAAEPYYLEEFTCGNHSEILFNKSHFLGCLPRYSLLSALISTIACDFHVKILELERVDNPENPKDSSTLLGALTAGAADFTLETTVTHDLAERFLFQYPYSFFRPALIIGPRFLQFKSESPLLMLKPYDPFCWLCIFATVVVVRVLAGKLSVAKFFAANLTLFATLYSSNLKAIITGSQHKTLPFRTYREFQQYFKANNLHLLMDRVSDYRMQYLNRSADFHPKHLIVEEDLSVLFSKLLNRKDFVYVEEIPYFIADYTRTLGRDAILDRFQFLDILPLPELFASTAVSRKRPEVVEFFSTLSPALTAFESLAKDRIGRELKMVAGQKTKPQFVALQHYMLIVYICSAGYLLSCLIFMMERSNFRFSHTLSDEFYFK